MKIKHLVLDTETLSYDFRAVVLSIGCVPFFLDTHSHFSEIVKDGFYVKFNAEEQIKKYKRISSPETIKWWKEQPKEVFDSEVRPSSNDKTLVEGLSLLNDFIDNLQDYKFKRSYVWSRGNYFDFPILKTLYEDANLKIPYNEWRIRDVRTAIDFMHGTDNGKYELRFGGQEFIPHNPLHDAAMDAARMNELFYILSEGENAPL